MTVENIILNSVKSQFYGFTGCQTVDEWQPIDANSIGVPGNGAFRARLGINIQNKLNALAALTVVSYCEVFIDILQYNKTDSWSAIIDLAMAFGNGGYTPPVPSPGDTIVVTSLKLINVQEPNYLNPPTPSIRRVTYAVLYVYQ